MIAYAETAGAMARRAAAAADGTLSEKADRRFDAPALAAISRVFAREAALRAAEDGLRWVVGSAEGGATQAAALSSALPLDAVRVAQAGLLADMNAVADALYRKDQS